MSDDWPDEGVEAACELATVWRRVFIKHRRGGDDDAWASHFADIAQRRFVERIAREARRSEQPDRGVRGGLEESR